MHALRLNVLGYIASRPTFPIVFMTITITITIGAVNLECVERKQGVSDVHGQHDQVQPQLRHLHHHEPWLRRSNRATGQPEGAYNKKGTPTCATG